MNEGDLIQAPEAHLLHGSAMPRILRDATAALVGKRIARVGYVIMDGSPWPCIVLEDETAIVIQRDDEGNGPGSASIYASEGTFALCRTSV